MTESRRLLPGFVFAGAGRAGSTAVVESLRRRPEVFVTEPKEPHYLALGGQPAAFTGPGDDVTINRVAVTEEAAYLGLFHDAPPGSLAGEGSVSTLYYHQVAAPRLQALNPAAKVVVVLREPVARAFSSHQYLVNRGWEPETDFLTAVTHEERRKAEGWHHLWHYTGMSRYAASVRAFVDTFGRDQVGVWWYDDLMSREEDTLRQIHAFLGLPDAPSPLGVGRVNVSGAPRRPRVQRALTAASRSAGLRRVVKAMVPFEVRERIRGANLAPNEVPDEVARALRPRFVDDLAQLEQLLGAPVPGSWTRR